MTATTRTRARRISRISRGMPTSDGAGVKLTRMLGHQGLDYLDPFLMLDQFRSDNRDDYIAGFPSHPHRGFETVTIMLDGRMRHGDNKGHKGVIGPGGIQWMTAGRGIVHSEMPEQENGRMWGFQLWVNLPANQKMTAPRYQEFGADQIPVEAREGSSVRVLAGRSASGTAGPVEQIATRPLLLDITLEPGASFSETVPAGHTVFISVYKGEVAAGRDAVSEPDLAVLSDGDHVELKAGAKGASFILVAGQPLHEPVARYGPFVMNTQAELQQAVTDFRAGKF